MTDADEERARDIVAEVADRFAFGALEGGRVFLRDAIASALRSTRTAERKAALEEAAKIAKKPSALYGSREADKRAEMIAETIMSKIDNPTQSDPNTT
jgi:hypothetical protein